MALALGVSLSGPRPSSFWLQVTIRHQTTLRKITKECTTTQTLAWSLFFFLFLVKKKQKNKKQNGERISDWVRGNRVPWPGCTALLRYSPLFHSACSFDQRTGGEGKGNLTAV